MPSKISIIPAITYEIGQHERLFKEKYESYVESILEYHIGQDAIENARQTFHHMQTENKEQKLKDVESLLRHLGISRSSEKCQREQSSVLREIEQNDVSRATCHDTTVVNVSVAPSTATKLDESRDLLTDEICERSFDLFQTQPENGEDFDCEGGKAPLQLLTRQKSDRVVGLSSLTVSENRDDTALKRDESAITEPGYNNENITSHQAEDILKRQHYPDFLCQEDASIEIVCPASLSPVEIRRKSSKFRHGTINNSMLQSPELFECESKNKKRLASCSGKKGTDTHRARFDYNAEIHDDYCNERADRRTSLFMLDEKNNAGVMSSTFLASQSPIERCGSEMSMDGSNHENDGDELLSPDNKEYNAKEKSYILSGHNNYEENCDSIHEMDTSLSPVPRRALQFSEREHTRDRFASKTQESLSYRNRGSRNSIGNDTIQSVNCTVSPRRIREKRNKGKEIPEALEVPAMYQLKEGTCFRMQTLKIKTTRSVHRGPKERTKLVEEVEESPCATPLSFPDPLESFPKTTSERLKVVTTWLEEQDDRVDTSRSVTDTSSGIHDDLSGTESFRKGVILSLLSDQSRAVVMSFLRSCRPRPRNDGMSDKMGGTVLIFRQKEDMDKWERFFRENTSYSVMNHGNLTSTARKKVSMSRISGFDITLTTYDACKAKEQTQPLDDMGRAIREKSTMGSNGWYSGRGGGRREEAQKCAQLSMLHSIVWWRVIFFDVLGKGSYITKAETSRHVAAKALLSKSRYIFFVKPEESTGMLEKKVKEDYKHLEAISGMLHMQEDRVAETIVGQNIMDMAELTMDENGLFDDSFCGQQRDKPLTDEEREGSYDSSDSEDIMSP